MLYRPTPSESRTGWLGFIGLVAILLLLPACINRFVSPQPQASEPVVLTGIDHTWEIPLTLGDNAARISCLTSSDDPMAVTWKCRDLTISSIVVSTTDNKDLLLRRIAHALVLPPELSLSSATVHTVVLNTRSISDARILVDRDRGFMAVSVTGTGDQDGTTLVAAVHGKGWYDAGAALWTSLTGRPAVAGVGFPRQDVARAARALGVEEEQKA